VHEYVTSTAKYLLRVVGVGSGRLVPLGEYFRRQDALVALIFKPWHGNPKADMLDAFRSCGHSLNACRFNQIIGYMTLKYVPLGRGVSDLCSTKKHAGFPIVEGAFHA
jgi:hypothetical protein